MGQIADRDGVGVDERRRRVYALAVVLSVVALALIARLGYIQVYEHARYVDQASAEHWRQLPLPPRRGDIVDAHDVPLATTVSFDTLYASTTEISDASTVAQELAPIINQSPTTLEALLGQRQTAPTRIQAGLPADTADKIRQLQLSGIFLQPEPKRVYPQGNLASQLLGVVGADDNGLSGLEQAFDGDLKGQPGSVVAERDTGGDAIAFGPTLTTPAQDGAKITLTIDRYVQWVAERELSAAIERQHASKGSVVVVDPRSGGLLAIASRPSFKLNDPDPYRPAAVTLYGLPAVSDPFEPGSAFLIFTFAAALDLGEVGPRTTLYNQGYLDTGEGIVRDPGSRPPTVMSLDQILRSSSSVGAAWLAAKVGARRYYPILQRFGFGEAPGLGLPGVSAGQLRLATAVDWSDFDLPTNAMGDGLSVTAAQLAGAFAAIANGGARPRLHVVESIAKPDSENAAATPEAVAAIRPETATALERMLVGTIDDESNPGHAAAVPGYAVAGIAGADSLLPTGGSSTSPTDVTFVGFAPAENPRFVVLVHLSPPSAGGTVTAAPVFGTIARQLLNYYQIPPSRSPPANGT
jgi:cell division protein FtsI (penicillin-binding protein 3)